MSKTKDTSPNEQELSSSAVETILQDKTKGTVEMRAALRQLQSSLTCPVCNSLFHDPVTLSSCGHSFCKRCIDVYSENNWNCPVCKLPMQSGRGGSFRKVHPALQTSILSFNMLCRTLQQAKPDWWKDCNNNDETAAPENEEEEMIDLMADVETSEPVFQTAQSQQDFQTPAASSDDDDETFATAQQD